MNATLMQVEPAPTPKPASAVTFEQATLHCRAHKKDALQNEVPF